MYPGNYDNFDKISEISGNGITCEKAQLAYKRELICCPDCEGNNIVTYDTKSPRKVIDVHETGKTVRLEIENKRYKCKKCGKVFNPNKYPACIPERARISTDCLSEIADYAVQFPGMTNKEIGSVFGVSPTVVSQALHERIESTEIKFISTLEPTKLLFIYPFEYFGKMRYAICGTDVNDDTVLYDIRPDYTPADIQCYFSSVHFHHSSTDNGAPWATFTDFNQDVINVLLDVKCIRSYDDEAPDLGIIKQLFEKKINEYRSTKTDVIGKTINGDLNYLLMSLFDDEDTTEDNFADKIQEWYQTPSDENDAHNAVIKAHLKPLYLLLDEYSPLCALIFAYTPEEMAIDKHLDFIPAFRSHNTPFEEMRYRILLHAENQECIPMNRMLSSKYEGLGVHRMRVNLKTINAIYTKSWHSSSDGEKDGFPEFYKL